jgi:hypothetical protein
MCFVKCGTTPDPACASVDRDQCDTDRLINRKCPEKCGQCLNSCGDEPDASSCTELASSDCVGDSAAALQTKIKCPGLCKVCKAVKDLESVSVVSIGNDGNAPVSDDNGDVDGDDSSSGNGNGKVKTNQDSSSAKKDSTGAILAIIFGIVVLFVVGGVLLVKRKNINNGPAFVAEGGVGRGGRGQSRNGPTPPINPAFAMPPPAARRETIQSQNSPTFEAFDGFGDASAEQPYDGNVWDWRGSTTKEAEGALANCAAGSFIIRDSSSAAATLCIVNPSDGTIYRRQIENVYAKSGPKFMLKTANGPECDQFASVNELVLKYQTSKKAAQSAGLPCKIIAVDTAA